MSPLGRYVLAGIAVAIALFFVGAHFFAVGKASAFSLLVPKNANDAAMPRSLAEAYMHIHGPDSGAFIRTNFPDLKLVYTDLAPGTAFQEDVPPFNYYYSAKADKTFGICAINKSVFICNGKLDRLVGKKDIDDGTCTAVPIYLMNDTRLGLLSLH